MNKYLVILKLPVQARDEQAAWEYGNALASRAPNQVASGVDEDGDKQADIVVEDVRE